MKFEVAKSEQEKRDYEYILPIVVDDVTLEGFEKDVGYIDLRQEGVLRTAEMMMEKLADVHASRRLKAPREWVSAFGVNMHELMENDELPGSVPSFYPDLCDWLERDLMERLAESGVRELRFGSLII